MTKTDTDKTDKTDTAKTDTAPTRRRAVSSGGQLVLLSPQAQTELFMHPTSHQVVGKCARTDQMTQCGQYPRSEVRVDHLAKQDRDEFNAKLDALAKADEEAVKRAEAAAEAAETKAQADADAITAKLDADYEKAVADRKTQDEAEAAKSKKEA